MTSREITTARPEGLPTLRRRTMDLERGLVCWRPDDPRLPSMLVRALSPDERQMLTSDLADLTARLAIRDRSRLERTVTVLLIAFPSGRASGDEAKVVVGTYVSVLSDLPFWAVEEAASEWMRGGGVAGTLAFQPSAAELHKAAAAKAAPYYAAAATMRALLNGITREQDDTERHRVADGLAKLRAELGATTEIAVRTASAFAGEPGEGPHARALREQIARERADAAAAG